MAILTVTAFVTLDGVMQAPGAPKEDPVNFPHGGWLVPYVDPDFGAFMSDIFERPTAFLLGRTTYQIFAAHWPRVSDEELVARKLNGLPKYVATRTLDRADWNNTTIVRDVVSEVGKLKASLVGELQVHGSAGLIQTLIENDLVDQYNVVTFPLVLGIGKRLFGAGTVPCALRLESSRTSTTGVVLSRYARAGKPTYGSFALDA